MRRGVVGKVIGNIQYVSNVKHVLESICLARDNMTS
jgi:hypothetical protein